MKRPLPPCRWLAPLLLGIVLGSPGCVRSPGARASLTIATAWPEPARNQLEKAFRQWLARTQPQGAEPPAIAWVALEPGDNGSALVEIPVGGIHRRLAAIDIVLGAPASAFAHWARDGRLIAIERNGDPSWCVARRSPLGLAARTDAEPSQTAAKQPTTFDDPRHDPIALAWAKTRLGDGTWAAGYADLVHEARGVRRIGRQPRSALAAVTRGEAVQTPAILEELPRGDSSLAFLPGPRPGEWVEGVAIVRGAKQPQQAQLFLKFLAETGLAESAPPDPAANFETDALLADLLGATLVDAQDELRTAWAVLERAGHPERAEMWMTQPPPWPPASVITLIEADQSGVLVDTLSSELVPDPEIRAWVQRSWLGSSRLVDDSLLKELAEAVDGRLVREPRFRAWLRAEWTAWARQRYRRVARKAGEALP